MKRKALIVAIVLLLISVGIFAFTQLFDSNGTISTDECNNCQIKSGIADTIKTNGYNMRKSGIDEAKEKIKIELERIEAEKREEERKKAQENRIASNAALNAPGEKYIALTFDDGPGVHTGRLLNILNSYGAKGTFFVVGRSIDRNPGVIQRMANEGHEIGGHSWSHPQFTKLGEADISSQITDTRNKIFGVAGVDSVLVRPPYGSVNQTARNVGASLGCSYINWSVDSLDWKSRNVEAIRYEILSNVKNGSIILCHDIHKTTVDAMEVIIPELQAKGFKFVTVSELLGTTTPGMVYYHR